MRHFKITFSTDIELKNSPICPLREEYDTIYSQLWLPHLDGDLDYQEKQFSLYLLYY